MCIYVQCVQKPTKSANRKQESDGSKNATHNMVYLYDACDQISDLFLPSTVTEKNATKISWTDGRTDKRTEVKQYTSLPLRGAGGYKNSIPPPHSGSGGIIIVFGRRLHKLEKLVSDSYLLYLANKNTCMFKLKL